MSIRINATVSEARAAAGHSKEQWDRFYVSGGGLEGCRQANRHEFITKDEAKQLSEAHPDWMRWILIPANEKESMLQRINGRLTAEGIPAVEMIILKWRVSQLLRDIQRKYGTSHPHFICIPWSPAYRYACIQANYIDCLAEGSMISGMGGSTGSPTQTQAHPESTSQQSQSTQRSESSPSDSRPFDPIRDV
jgi:hypothetical protein